MKDLAVTYYGADRPGADIPEALLNSCWSQDMLTSFPAAYFAIKAFSETDTSEDLKKIDVPTLILHGDVDQIVPVTNAYWSANLISNATLKVYPGAPHAFISTSKNEVSQDLLAFIGEQRAPKEDPVRTRTVNSAADADRIELRAPQGCHSW